MFRAMRRPRQELSEAETIAVLESCPSGVLAVQGDDDYPYAVPLSLAYEEGRLFCHAANAGHLVEDRCLHGAPYSSHRMSADPKGYSAASHTGR
jgi:hypothetical protein